MWPGHVDPGRKGTHRGLVSGLNECRYCYSAHAAYAAAQLPEGMALVEQVHDDVDSAPVSAKMRALLDVAGAVQRGGREVTEDLVTAARAEGATDVEIHDTVLIAAAFCMFNRYVDGLATVLPDDPDFYTIAHNGSPPTATSVCCNRRSSASDRPGRPVGVGTPSAGLPERVGQLGRRGRGDPGLVDEHLVDHPGQPRRHGAEPLPYGHRPGTQDHRDRVGPDREVPGVAPVSIQ